MDENIEKNDNSVETNSQNNDETVSIENTDDIVDIKEDEKANDNEVAIEVEPDNDELYDQFKMKRKRKWKWPVIIIVVIVVLALGILSGMVLNIHNSTFDCSYEYTKVDNLVTEMARKHTYYNAIDKTLEVELNQDIINSLIKDYIDDIDMELPEKVKIKEFMFNTRDQRAYINAKYGNLNVPLNIKVNYNISDTGIEFIGSDIKLAKMNAPEFLKRQLSGDILKYSLKYEDLDVPKVFVVKDILFGSGTAKIVIQLKTDKIMEMAMEYRDSLIGEIDKYKASQSGIINTFLTKLLGTEILSDAKVKEYVEKALDNEELVNSVREVEQEDRYENFHHGLFLGLFMMVGTDYIVDSNKEYGLGRPDIVIIPKDINKTVYVFEFKWESTKGPKSLENLVQVR
jgi:hypothetical protein